MPLPFSQACENNQTPILTILQSALAHSSTVLEIGSGTGQHSIHFAKHLPHLQWHTSDLPQHHAGILEWHAANPLANVHAPIHFDLHSNDWPAPNDHGSFDAVFTSNTAHIVSWPLVQRMFQLAGQNLPPNGILVVYGPFNYAGTFTSESNRAFDAWLRQRDSLSGIRHFEDIVALAQAHGLHLQHDHPMPANNRTLVFQKRALA